MSEVKVKMEYESPLCQGCNAHKRYFKWEILNKPICGACDQEISAMVDSDQEFDIIIKTLKYYQI